jgi:hypothetical protein
MLSRDTWESALSTAWRKVQDRVERDGGLEFSHEHTVQFYFAWETAQIVGPTFEVRFEVPCGRDAHGETLRLDLLMWTDPMFKIAVEMKAPIRSEAGMNSAMTQFRMRFYRDVDRLGHLVRTKWNSIQRGMFLAVVNERGYVLKRGQRVNEPYATYDGTQLAGDTRIPACPGANGCDFELMMPSNPIVWKWSTETTGQQVNPAAGRRHYWLEPILVFPSGVGTGR